jgi:menaquinone-dependent protoporphyrinogen IX oxidase
MKGVIIYQGKYGATNQYARWLADALGLPVLRAQSATPAMLSRYDFVILGSSIYVGKLVIVKWLQQNMSLLANKKVFLFIVCGTTIENKVEQRKIIDNNLDPESLNTAETYFIPGRCVVSKLSWKDHLMLKMGAWLEKDPIKKNVMKQGFDRMDKKNLEPLIFAVKQSMKETAIC